MLRNLVCPIKLPSSQRLALFSFRTNCSDSGLQVTYSQTVMETGFESRLCSYPSRWSRSFLGKFSAPVPIIKPLHNSGDDLIYVECRPRTLAGRLSRFLCLFKFLSSHQCRLPSSPPEIHTLRRVAKQLRWGTSLQRVQFRPFKWRGCTPQGRTSHLIRNTAANRRLCDRSKTNRTRNTK